MARTKEARKPREPMVSETVLREIHQQEKKALGTVMVKESSAVSTWDEMYRCVMVKLPFSASYCSLVHY